jgi:regulator of sigma E protease
MHTRIDGVAEGSPASKTVRASDGSPFPLRKGDLITSAAGKALEPGDAVLLRRILFDSPGETIPITIRRGAEVISHLDRDDDGAISPHIEYAGGEEIELRMTVGKLHPSRLGALPREHPVVSKEIPEGAPAHGILRKGDTILRVQGEDSRTRSILQALRYGRGQPVEVTVLRGGEEVDVTLTPGFTSSGQYMVGVEYDSEPVIGEVLPDSPAGRADLRRGDRILEVEGQDLSRWLGLEGFATAVREKYTLTVKRAEETLKVDIVPEPAEEIAYGYGGILFGSPRFVLRSGSIVEAASLGVRGTIEWIGKVFLTIRRLASREIHAKNLGGIVMIADTSYRFATLGLGTMLYFLGIISVNLAILNILPIPILDGGLLFFLLIEKLKGSPVQEKYMVIANYVGLALLLTLMVYVTYNDITRIIVR